MKFHETHFEDYILSNKRENLHSKFEKIFQKFPSKIQDLKNVIFYGPSGIGKYTQMLRILKSYSSTDLKYEKKISVLFNKQQYFLKISDIHYEIDMSLLGCNSKLLWHEIYQNIIDIISAKTDKVGIVVCKNFHEIHNELLENFYSYMQQNETKQVILHFFIITQEISFIPDNILNCCEIISLPRPSKTFYNKCVVKKLTKDFKLDNITNIKNLHLPRDTNNLMQNYKIICDKIIDTMIQEEPISFLKFRSLLYDLLIYNLNITESIWYIVSQLLERKKITESEMGPLLLKTYSFFQYFNNNYRPIYHLENYFYFLVTLIQKYK